MFYQILPLVLCVVAANAGGIGLGGVGIAAVSGGHGHVVDLYTHPRYDFQYGVADGHTGDHKQQSEARDGDVVRGQYSIAEPDGTLRVVHYTADDHNGFNAHVSRIGHAVHPQRIAVGHGVAVSGWGGGAGGAGGWGGAGGVGGLGGGWGGRIGGHW